MTNIISHCEVCGGTSLESVLDLGLHPMCDDLVRVGDSRVCKEYPIEILYCAACCTAHQKYQIPKHELFPQDYHYRARHTGDVLAGMKQLVETVAAKQGPLQGRMVLDIGCNDGSLLGFFREQGARTFGIEPTGAAADAKAAGHEVTHAYFEVDTARAFVAAHGKPDFITFTNVFAHIEDLNGVIAALKVLMHEGTVIVIENHYLGAVLERFQFDTFYHEHPRTYSYTSFAHIGDKLGMKIGHVEFPPRYNGNIRVMYVPAAQADGHAGWEEHHARELTFGDGLREMARMIGPWRSEKLAEIEAAVKLHGPLRAKAFPGRSAIPVKLLGLDERHISAVYEKPQSGKIGHYVPGTRVPIVSDDDFDLKAGGDAPLLNLAWHISREITTYLRGRGFEGPIIDIISPDGLDRKKAA